MADDGTAVIILEGSKWRQCDVDMAFLTEKLKQPKEKIDTPGHKGIIIQPAMTIIACAIHPDLSEEVALDKLREYIKANNPELKDEDFDLEVGLNDHLMTGYPPTEKILHISVAGCTFPGS